MGEEEARLEGQAHVWRCMFGFMDSMALKCAVDLRIPDIINSHGKPISISVIKGSIIDAPSLDINYLSRIMRYLVRKQVFSTETNPDTGETLYGLTYSSKWLLSKDTQLTLAPFLELNNQWLMDPCHHISDSVRDGELAFVKENGLSLWNLASQNPKLNQVFNDGMACVSKIIADVMLVNYKNEGGFQGVGSLVDVAGGIGAMISEIVKGNPHVRGINFDLPHVIATAPEYPGVEHVAGDMFIDIPCAEAVMMKWIMHDWNDEDCIKILKNCRKSIPETTGKVIIIDFILKPNGNGIFDDVGMAYDLLMMADTIYGKERTEEEWTKLLKDGGFPRYKIIEIPALLSIIEAYPV